MYCSGLPNSSMVGSNVMACDYTHANTDTNTPINMNTLNTV